MKKVIKITHSYISFLKQEKLKHKKKPETRKKNYTKMVPCCEKFEQFHLQDLQALHILLAR